MLTLMNRPPEGDTRGDRFVIRNCTQVARIEQTQAYRKIRFKGKVCMKDDAMLAYKIIEQVGNALECLKLLSDESFQADALGEITELVDEHAARLQAN